MSAAVALLLVIVAAGSAIAAVTLGSKAKAAWPRRSAGGRAQEKLAVAAARAANEQNRNRRRCRGRPDSSCSMRKLRYVPAIQNEREQLLDKAIARLEAAAQAMTDLRRDVELGPRGRGTQLAVAGQGSPGAGRVSLSRNQVHDAMAQFRQAEEIIARLAAANPDDLDLQVNLFRTQREIGYVSMIPTGRLRGGADSTSARRSRSAGRAWRRSPTTTLTRVSWPIRWACSRGRN